jgi:hypothetical protein
LESVLHRASFALRKVSPRDDRRPAIVGNAEASAAHHRYRWAGWRW